MISKPIDLDSKAGQSVYSKPVLNIYDFVVVEFSNAYIWKCRKSLQLDMYSKYISKNHLDIGVGSGYFLDNCKPTVENPSITLMDLNYNSLQYTKNRISRYKPEIVQYDVLKPFPNLNNSFDSIGINYLLHCLPGNLSNKAILFDHCKTVMNDNAIIFGATILSLGIEKNWAAKRLMKIYNKKGIFSNTEDSLKILEQELNYRFREVSIQVVGCVALFTARK